MLFRVHQLPPEIFWQIALPCFTEKGAKKHPRHRILLSRGWASSAAANAARRMDMVHRLLSLYCCPALMKSVMQCKEVIIRISYAILSVKLFCKRLSWQIVNFFAKTPQVRTQGVRNRFSNFYRRNMASPKEKNR